MKRPKINYVIQTNTGSVIVEASNPFAALGIHRKRGPYGLGKGWTLTRQPNGWIVAANSDQRTLEGGYHRLREQNYDRSMRAL